MDTNNNPLYYFVSFVLTAIISWIVLFLVLMWFKPSLYEPDGRVNLWTTLFVAVLLVLFVWIGIFVLKFIFKLMNNGNGNGTKCCVKPNGNGGKSDVTTSTSTSTSSPSSVKEVPNVESRKSSIGTPMEYSFY